MEIIDSIVLVGLNLFIAKFLLKRNPRLLVYALCCAAGFVLINLFSNLLAFRLTLVVLFYSVSILVIDLLSSRATVVKDSSHISEPARLKFMKIKSFIIAVLFPIMITVFQIIVLYDKEIQNGLLE